MLKLELSAIELTLNLEFLSEKSVVWKIWKKKLKLQFTSWSIFYYKFALERSSDTF